MCRGFKAGSVPGPAPSRAGTSRGHPEIPDFGSLKGQGLAQSPGSRSWGSPALAADGKCSVGASPGPGRAAPWAEQGRGLTGAEVLSGAGGAVPGPLAGGREGPLFPLFPLSPLLPLFPLFPLLPLPSPSGQGLGAGPDSPGLRSLFPGRSLPGPW